MCWKLHGAQWARWRVPGEGPGEMRCEVRCEGPEVGEVGSRDAVYPHFILQRAGSLEMF